MRKIILFIASSSAGYIAYPSGEIDWLFTDQGYSYTSFLEKIDTALMDRVTYEQVLAFDEYPYRYKNYAFTKNTDLHLITILNLFHKTLCLSQEIYKVLRGRDIGLMGDSILIRDFMRHQFIDQLVMPT